MCCIIPKHRQEITGARVESARADGAASIAREQLASLIRETENQVFWFVLMDLDRASRLVPCRDLIIMAGLAMENSCIRNLIKKCCLQFFCWVFMRRLRWSTMLQWALVAVDLSVDDLVPVLVALAMRIDHHANLSLK